MRFYFKTKVVIIYGFVKIIYSVCLPSRKQHEKSVETSLPELRVTTPTPSNKFSTPYPIRQFENLFLKECPPKGRLW